jgi:replicative DNA helicase
MFGPESPLFGLSERLPPSNLQAEQALLGAVLSNNRALYLCEGLEVEHFADPIHGRIFEQARKLADAGRLADPVTLKAAFEHAGVLEDVGGTRYLTQLLSAMILINNAGITPASSAIAGYGVNLSISALRRST